MVPCLGALCLVSSPCRGNGQRMRRVGGDVRDDASSCSRDSVPAWGRRPLRIAALQTAFDSPGINALDVWQRLGFNAEQLLHAIGEGYFAIFRPAHEIRVRAYVTEAHRRGLRVILYLNTHLLDPADSAHHETWAARDIEGRPRILYGTFRGGCVHTGWGDHLIGMAQQACHCGVDGIFSDGPLVGCWCETCRSKFRESGGGDDLQGPVYRAFMRRALVKFIQRFYQAVKAENPQAVFYQNLDVVSRAASALVPWNDWLGTEGGFLFYGSPARSFLWKTSRAARMLEGLAQGKPTVIFVAADHKPWSLYPHTPVETRLAVAAAAANGAHVWYGLHFPLSRFRGAVAAAVKDILHFLRRHEPWYTNTVSCARVALLHSALSREEYRRAVAESDFYSEGAAPAREGLGDPAASFDGFAAMLYRQQIPFDILPEEAPEKTFARYRALLVPTAPCLSDATLARLRQYVARGGNLVACLDVGFFDEHGRPRAPAFVQEVLGLRWQRGFLLFQPFDYLALEEGSGPLRAGIGSDLLPAPLRAMRVVPAGARVLAWFHAPMPGRYVELSPRADPAILEHRFGKGRTLYLAGNVGEFYLEYGIGDYATLIANMLHQTASLPVRLIGAPESVEIVHRAHRRRPVELVHLVNYTGGMTRPMGTVVPVHGLKLEIKRHRLRRVQSLRTNRCLRLHPGPNGRRAQIALPPLRDYDVIVLEYERRRRSAVRSPKP